MIYLLTNTQYAAVTFIGILFAFVASIVAIAKLSRFLPRDMGRAFAHDGSLSAGKPRGAGLIFVLAFVVAALIFSQLNVELALYLALIVIEMFTGFFDDAADKPWGELLKGILDFLVAVIVALVYLRFNGSEMLMPFTGRTVTVPPLLFGILTVVLVWVSINVTNCADGVDGLSGTLTLISIITFFILDHIVGVAGEWPYCILLFGACLLGYLWYNATPSRLLMGDAGSRAMGIFIALAALKSGCPLLYIPAAIVIIIDGGLGLVKLTLKRVLKKILHKEEVHVMDGITTPVHDHMRKKSGWSNEQVVFRFSIIQIVISMAVVYLATGWTL
ncbi:MAG: phospho-N-acetylmuramoyl-pentapeptide-transferase [Clostridiales bacterium]|nr:phospho-N-acetylmuramoyl-pentapeptide-transferase [Clostridiales bacterium]